MAKISLPALALLVLALAVGPAYAINCVEVDMALLQCVPYLTGQVEEPAAACCDGIVHIENIATTTPDRQQACGCMKEAASHITGLKDSCVSALPGKCNAPLPYPISASVDCSQIH